MTFIPRHGLHVEADDVAGAKLGAPHLRHLQYLDQHVPHLLGAQPKMGFGDGADSGQYSRAEGVGVDHTDPSVAKLLAALELSHGFFDR